MTVAQNPPVQQQNQTVQTIDAGGGNKQELVRNAAGQEVENRTYDPQGRLRAKVSSIYPPGHFAPDQMTTAFYPDGKLRTTAKVTYDPSANFLTEVTEQFDESGKHISGHKLVHDPVNGMFRCWKWNAPGQKYDRVVCPSGEESGEKPPPMKPLTEEEALKMLAAARTAATAQQKSERMTAKNPVTPSATPTDIKFALVIPANLIPGQRLSGSVQENPYLFRLRPDLIVQELNLSMPPGSEASKLSGWRVEIAGSQPQRADTPFTFTVPNNGSQIDVKLYPEGDAGHAVTRNIAFQKTSSKQAKPKPGYVAQALCVAGDVCPIAGQFSGDATNSLASFDETPATIAAETPDMVFVRVPDDLQFGEKHLLFNEGNELLAFPVAAAQVDVVVDGRQLDTFQQQIQQGQNKLVFAGVIGVQSLPEDQWREGTFPASNLEWARRFVPGFQVPHESHAEREEREKMEKLERQAKSAKPAGNAKEEKIGTIVYFVKNTTPDVVSWRGAKDGAFALPLNPESFSQGDFRYKFMAEAGKSGTFAMDAAVIPFVAPVQGQKFTVSASAGSH
jgi:hypothetical protein